MNRLQASKAGRAVALAVACLSFLGCAADFYPRAEGVEADGAPIGPKDMLTFNRDGMQFVIFAKNISKSVTGRDVKVYCDVLFVSYPRFPTFMFKSKDFTVSIASEVKHVLPDHVTGWKPTYGLGFPQPILRDIPDWQSLDGNEFGTYYLVFSLRFPGATTFVFQVPPMLINGEEVILSPITFAPAD